MSSDFSDTMVWFGQILLYLHFYHPVYIILATDSPEVTGHVVPGNTIIVLVVEHGQAGLVVELLETLDGDADVVLSVDGPLLDTFVVVWLRLSLPEIIQTSATLEADAETMPASDHQLTSVLGWCWVATTLPLMPNKICIY